MPTHITIIEATPGRSEELGNYLRDLLEPVRQLDGCMTFDVQCLQQRWKLRGRWRSSAAMEGYFRAPLLHEVLDSAWRSGAVRRLDSHAA